MCTVNQLLKEFDDLFTIFGKRMQVLRDVFRVSGERRALSLSAQLNEIFLENDRVYQRLQADKALAKPDVLLNVWNISRMKQIYHPVLKDYAKSAALCASWKNRPEILKEIDEKNQQIMKHDLHRYVNTSTFPTVVKDHLFNVLHLLVKYNLIVKTPILRRFEDLVQWLDKEQPTVSNIKGFPVSSLPSALKHANELVLKMDTFRLPTCDSKDAEKAEVVLSPQHVIVRTVRGGMFRKDETVEHQSIAKIELQEAYDDATFELLGVGFTKVLSADSQRTRDDWMWSILEVQKSLTSSAN